MRRLVGVLFFVACPAIAAAQVTQVPSPPRGDVAGTVGWLHVPFASPADSLWDERWTHHATATVTAGLYWTDHWKTELSASVSNRADAWTTELLQFGSDTTYRSATHRIRYSEVSIAQLYQFGRNDWVHPAIGAGVLVQRRTGESEYSPIVIPRAPGGGPALIDPGGLKELTPRTMAAPFVAAALKAYVTPSAFFRADVQVAFREDVDAVVLHAGFGIDF